MIQDFDNQFNSLEYTIERNINNIWTSIPAVVKNVNTNNTSVDVLPLLKQVDKNKNEIDVSILYNLPYIRIQGGKNAIIIDPQIGDIGIIIFQMRDIFNIKNTCTNNPVNPKSYRKYDPSDGIFLCGFCNYKDRNPERYLKIDNSGIIIEGYNGNVTINGNAGITLNSSSNVTINSPIINLNGIINQTQGSGSGSSNFQNDIVSNNISFQHHIHSNVQNGPSNTGQPVN